MPLPYLCHATPNLSYSCCCYNLLLRTDLSQPSLLQLPSFASWRQAVAMLPSCCCLTTVAQLLLILLPAASAVSRCLTCNSVNLNDKACEKGELGTRYVFPLDLKTHPGDTFQPALPGPQQLRLHGLPHQDGRAGRVAHSWLLLAQGQELAWTAVHGGRGDGERARECEGDKLHGGELQLGELGGKGDYRAESTTPATAGDPKIKIFIRFSSQASEATMNSGSTPRFLSTFVIFAFMLYFINTNTVVH